MASNQFGTHFRLTTWGESHGPAVGVVIDGCPAGLLITKEEIDAELAKRAPGNSPFTSPRKEPDQVEILSGLFEGVTTGAPISLLIRNGDAKPQAYDPIRHLIRPGHANGPYLQKYGIYDHRGSGRASARETAARVAAGAVAKKLLQLSGIQVGAYLKAVGDACRDPLTPDQVITGDDPPLSAEMIQSLEEVMKEGDSLGGLVEFVAIGKLQGLGDPIYEKLEALLACAMMSIPATKGFEVGSGFAATKMRGSAHNQPSYAGGILGGIATEDPLVCRVAFKPTSSIRKPQKTIDLKGNSATLTLPLHSRHDPCVAIRGTKVVEAMGALVLADRLLAATLAKAEGAVPCS